MGKRQYTEYNMKMLLKRNKLLQAIAITGIVFLFYALISHWTPVSGDDWVYAVGGRWNNPFQQAFLMYQTWSGRYLSELWGFLVAPHKHLWNILNPLFFTAVFCLILKISEARNNVLSGLVTFLLMLCVANRLRMQTYTWIMGTTYVIPLLLFFLQMILLKRWIFEDKKGKYTFIILGLLNFCIPLYMENAAALLCGADLLVIIYLFFREKKKLKPMCVLFIIAVIGTLIILLSPGATARLVNDNAEFNSLSLFQKIAYNWPLFLDHTFLESNLITYGILLISSVWAVVKGRNKTFYWVILPVLSVISALLNQGWLYLLWTAALIGIILAYEPDQQKKWFLVYLILCALGANVVMLVSPIFDSRSSLYTIYMWILLSVVLFQEIPLEQNAFSWSIGVISAVLLGIRMFSYYDIYHLVHLINIRRAQQIEYYRVRPDAGDAWLLAYPDDSIHSPNVVEGDDTHMYYFKEYYYLNQDLHLVFYYLKDYNAQTIFEAQE